ncbi:MAG TPA: cytochrome c3 family protein [Desulfosalsimonadaceae bacterium]|nr:cytochrome c3 family protein [Desulfosalsimonadaceae bacterium]
MKKIALFIGIVCLFVFLGCGQEEKAEAPAQQETREAAESVKETPGETAEELKQKAGETVESAKEKTREVVEGAKKETEETVKAAREKTAETVAAAEEKTRETAAAAKKQTQEAAETVKKEAEQTVEGAKEKTSQAVEGLKEKTIKAVEGARQKAKETLPPGMPGVITMKNEKAFEQHRMGIVAFDHQKHAADKPEGYGLGCGDCHHDENGEPLTDLKPGDEVQSCYECHDKDGRPRRDPALSPEEWKKEELTYYYGAIHENCMGCHKKMGGGPVSCTECHPRPQQQ